MSVFDEQIETLSNRLTADLKNKVNYVLNYGDNQITKKEHIFENFERFVDTQQAILNDCTTLLMSKLRIDDPTFEPKFNSYGTSDPSTILSYTMLLNVPSKTSASHFSTQGKAVAKDSIL